MLIEGEGDKMLLMVPYDVHSMWTAVFAIGAVLQSTGEIQAAAMPYG